MLVVYRNQEFLSVRNVKRKAIALHTHMFGPRRAGLRRREAGQIFLELHTLLEPGDMLSSMMHDRCKNFIANPPPESWDGSDVLRAKHF